MTRFGSHVLTAIGAAAVAITGWIIINPYSEIPPPEAGGLMGGYVATTTLSGALENVFGGTFPKEALYDGKQNVGVKLWYCFDDQATNPNPRVFLAAEIVDKYGWPTPTDNPNAQILQRPEVVFEFKNLPAVPSQTQMLTYISGMNNVPTCKSVGINGNQIDALARTFNSKAGAYCAYRSAFFIYDADFLKLFNQTGVTHIRYFFGYDKDELGNKLRIILVGADKNGKNLTDGKDPVTNKDYIFLQKSVPPPPGS